MTMEPSKEGDDHKAYGKPSPGPLPCRFQRLPIAKSPGLVPAHFAVDTEARLETRLGLDADESGRLSAFMAKGAGLGIDAS